MPKKYVEEVGDEGFKKRPIGTGPYKFVSFSPGLELVLEAFEGYWRKTPAVKRIVMKVIQEEMTRFAALQGGEVDIAYSIRSEFAEAVQRIPGLSIKSVVLQAPFWIYFPEQWDPKSPWHDLRVRQAANLAIDREEMNKALFLGYCKVTNSIIPENFEYYWQPPPAVYDPVKAKKLLAQAGFPTGFDAGQFYCDFSYSNIGEAVANYFQEVGIRAKLQPIERGTFGSAFGAKQYTRGILLVGSGAFGNAATRLAAFAVTDGPNVYGSYLDIDELYAQQVTELDRRSGLRSSKRCSGWCTRGRSLRRSGHWHFSTVLAPGSESRHLAGSPAFPMQRLSRTSRLSRRKQLQKAPSTPFSTIAIYASVLLAGR